MQEDKLALNKLLCALQRAVHELGVVKARSPELLTDKEVVHALKQIDKMRYN